MARQTSNNGRQRMGQQQKQKGAVSTMTIRKETTQPEKNQAKEFSWLFSLINFYR